MPEQEKSITLHPSWKAFFWSYFFGVILIPLLIGIYFLWKTVKKHRSISYTITDHKITTVEATFSQSIDLVNIRQVLTVEQRFGISSVILKTNSREMKLVGMEQPDQLKNTIEKAVSAELARLETEKQVQPKEVKFKPGEMDRMDYLTGLWQQGLISDEDFERES